MADRHSAFPPLHLLHHAHARWRLTGGKRRGSFRRGPRRGSAATLRSLEGLHAEQRVRRTQVTHRTATGRDVDSDRLFIDKSSNKLIVSGPASGKSAFNSLGPGSALASNKTWRNARTFRYYIR